MTLQCHQPSPIVIPNGLPAREESAVCGEREALLRLHHGRQKPVSRNGCQVLVTSSGARNLVSCATHSDRPSAGARLRDTSRTGRGRCCDEDKPPPPCGAQMPGQAVCTKHLREPLIQLRNPPARRYSRHV